MENKVHVISLGGSIIAPEDVDTDFLKAFGKTLRGYLAEKPGNRLIIVCGGGATARKYQHAYREILGEMKAGENSEAMDWIGIMATRLNAELIRQLFPDLCPQKTVTNPEEVNVFAGRVMVAAGWKPGFSTDYDAVLLAERFGAEKVINLSNIKQAYTADPKVDPDARPIDRTTWSSFRKLVGDEWIPGINVPFDPVASKRAEKAGLTVVITDGRNLDNLLAILNDMDFVGTTITPD